MTRLLLASSLLFFVAVAQAQQPPGPPTAESRLRDALKKLTVRVSEAEAKGAASQAAEAEAKAKIEELNAKIDKLTKDLAKSVKTAAEEKDTADRTIESLNAKVAARDKELALYKEALGKWEKGFGQAKAVAEAKENERKQAADKLIVAERKVAEYERKNAEMYKAGTEVLERYAKFGLGTALLSREPFVGSMRVKFQNMIQDYGDKLNTERIKPENGDKKDGQSGTPAPAKTDAKPAPSAESSTPAKKS